VAVLGGVRARLVCLDNPHSPVGVFAQHPGVFGLSTSLGSYQAGLFRSGVPAGYLKVTAPGLTQTQADALKGAWMRAHGGDRRSIAVLNATTDFTPISINPVDAALAEVKRLNIADVAYAFGMAPESLGVTMGNSATYSNVEQWFEAHRDMALSPWIAAVEGVLSALLPHGQVAQVNLDAYTQAPWASRIPVYAQAISAGLLTVDEMRAAEGYPPLGGGGDAAAS
jgi:HK97 family phage portal protein